METSNEWLFGAEAEYPPDGSYRLRLESVRKRNLRYGPRLQWEWSFVEHTNAATFGTLTTLSMKRSNALGILTALARGTGPALPVDPRRFVGREIRARTTANKRSYPALLVVRPTDATSPFEYELQTKKGTTHTAARGETDQ